MDGSGRAVPVSPAGAARNAGEGALPRSGTGAAATPRGVAGRTVQGSTQGFQTERRKRDVALGGAIRTLVGFSAPMAALTMVPRSPREFRFCLHPTHEEIASGDGEGSWDTRQKPRPPDTAVTTISRFHLTLAKRRSRPCSTETRERLRVPSFRLNALERSSPAAVDRDLWEPPGPRNPSRGKVSGWPGAKSEGAACRPRFSSAPDPIPSRRKLCPSQGQASAYFFLSCVRRFAGPDGPHRGPDVGRG